MNLFAKLGFGAVMLAGLALAPSSSVLAASWPHGNGGHSSHSGPPQGFHGAMPAHNFHGAPPGFHGSPHGFHSSAMAGAHNNFHPGSQGGPGQNFHGNFHGHDFAHFSANEHAMWQHGQWRHSWHNGHLGWWWFADGGWFFYPEPIYPYPTYVGPDYYYDSDEYDDGGYGSDYSWYWCNDPRGYYPYVQECNEQWQPVSPTPPGRYGNQGGYDDQNGDDQDGGDGPNQ